jgi:hypothetical protein
MGAIAWGLVTLLLLTPKVHAAVDEGAEGDICARARRLASMRLQDSGPTGKQSGAAPADILASVFERVPVAVSDHHCRLLATPAGEGEDLEVVRNILNDLPGCALGGEPTSSPGCEANEDRHPWRQQCDPHARQRRRHRGGDGHAEDAGVDQHVVLIGVGDPNEQVHRRPPSRGRTPRRAAGGGATQGTYHNGNDKHLASDG